VATQIRIAELEWDEHNEAELWAHRITPEEVHQLVRNRPVVRRNKKRRSGTHKLIGRTNGGRAISVIIAPTHVPERWRPITGWDSTRGEQGDRS
jgi:hypothetical protein